MDGSCNTQEALALLPHLPSPPASPPSIHTHTYQYALAKMGILFGLSACTIVTCASIIGSMFLLEIYMANPQCENLPDLGRAALVSSVDGGGRKGKEEIGEEKIGKRR